MVNLNLHRWGSRHHDAHTVDNIDESEKSEKRSCRDVGSCHAQEDLDVNQKARFSRAEVGVLKAVTHIRGGIESNADAHPCARTRGHEWPSHSVPSHWRTNMK